MSRFILSWKGFLGWAVVLAIVIGLQYGIRYMIDDEAVVSDDTKCMVKGMRQSENIFGKEAFSVELALDCGGIEAETNLARAVLYHIRHPAKPLACKTYRSGSIKCDQPEESEE